MSDADDKVRDVLALLRGEPGPFLENEKSFFGRKRVDPSMKDRPMETDCGGMLITPALSFGRILGRTLAAATTAFDGAGRA